MTNIAVLRLSIITFVNIILGKRSAQLHTIQAEYVITGYPLTATVKTFGNSGKVNMTF